MKPPPSKNDQLEASLGKQLLTAGVSACIADLLTFPLDTAKVRLQVSWCFFEIETICFHFHYLFYLNQSENVFS